MQRNKKPTYFEAIDCHFMGMKSKSPVQTHTERERERDRERERERERERQGSQKEKKKEKETQCFSSFPFNRNLQRRKRDYTAWDSRICSLGTALAPG